METVLRGLHRNNSRQIALVCAPHLIASVGLVAVQIGGCGLLVPGVVRRRIGSGVAPQLAGLRKGRLLVLEPCPTFNQEGLAWAKHRIIRAGERRALELSVVGSGEPV
jgi:hypothetical protein